MSIESTTADSGSAAAGAPPPATPELTDSELSVELAHAVRDMLSQLSPPAKVIGRCGDDGAAYDQGLWTTLARDMGLAGLAVPEEFGGGGAGPRELAVVLTELGRSVAPTPYLGSAVLATTALLALSADPARDKLLRALATGEATAALAVPLAGAPGPQLPTVTAEADTLTGEVRGVADARTAGTLLVPTAAGLYAVAAEAGGLTRAPVVSLDLTRPLCDLRFDGTPGQRLAPPPVATAAVAAAVTAGAALLASEQVGLAQWCLDTTVAYVGSRQQFGRPVGSFQAVKHRLADVWVALAQARAVAGYAAAVLAEQPPASWGAGTGEPAVATALAQAFCGPVAVRAAEECVQLHGGIGFTWEHPAHLYLKRAKAAAVAFGSADRHRGALAPLLNLPAD